LRTNVLKIMWSIIII